jgi:hypothetical protein
MREWFPWFFSYQKQTTKLKSNVKFQNFVTKRRGKQTKFIQIHIT